MWRWRPARKGVVDNAVHLEDRRGERPARHGDVVPVAAIREFLTVAPGDGQDPTLATRTITCGEIGLLGRVGMSQADRQ